VTFHGQESGFCVLRVKARGHRDLVTVVGHAAMISAGEWLTASGEWTQDATHGLQVRARFLKTSEPTSAEDIEKYLGSSLVRGIGPVYAKRLVALFGTDVFDVIEASPQRLREVGGLGPKRMARITSAWADQKVIREVMVVLHAHGRGRRAGRAHLQGLWARGRGGHDRDPYRLARDVRGIGFKTADAIAAKLGFENTAMIRVRAGISFALTEAMGQGHCGLPVQELTALAEKLLEVPSTLIENAIALEVAEGTVVESPVGEAPDLFLAGLYHAERGIAERVRTLMAGPLPWPEIDASKALPWIESRTSLSLAPSQAEALRLALRSKVLVITGGPGVGKTTLVNSILQVLGAKGVRMLLCAPTGRAAKRMSEATGLEAHTIHRLLETDPKSGGFKRDENSPLDCDLLVVDESSRVDVPLMRAPPRRARQGRAPAGGRRRPAALGRARPSAGRPHRIGRHPCGAPDGGLPAGRPEPHHRHRPPDQPRPDAGSREPEPRADLHFVPADDPSGRWIECCGS
jgi:exodeoxyribonuclease V alpha subunit